MGGFLLQKTGLPAWSCLPPPVTRAELSAVRVLFAGLVSMANFSHGSELAGSRFQLPEGRSLQVCEWRESVLAWLEDLAMTARWHSNRRQEPGGLATVQGRCRMGPEVATLLG